LKGRGVGDCFAIARNDASLSLAMMLRSGSQGEKYYGIQLKQGKVNRLLFDLFF